ncbi:MAG: precorrin methylase [Rhodobacteraceae bacterium]|nr:MAG: precorrin methylase [Paracoccaceae bacterium]
MIVAGFGFRESATRESLTDALARAAGSAPVAVCATAEDKAAALAAALGRPVTGVAEEAIRAQKTRTRSAAALAARGTGSVAEAAALAAAGPGARLLARRVVSGDRRATCALAESAAP